MADYGNNRDLPAKMKTKYHHQVKSMVVAFIKACPEKGAVVDIGTRDGYAVELLAKAGYNALGTDIIPEFVEHAKASGRNVILDDIMDATFQYSSFDYIISRHCIEHVPHPTKFLAECRLALKSTGKIFITFPLETKQQAGKNEYHMCNFVTKDDFRKMATDYFNVEYLGKSKRYGIIPSGKEMLFIGTPHA